MRCILSVHHIVYWFPLLPWPQNQVVSWGWSACVSLETSVALCLIQPRHHACQHGRTPPACNLSQRKLTKMSGVCWRWLSFCLSFLRCADHLETAVRLFNLYFGCYFEERELHASVRFFLQHLSAQCAVTILWDPCWNWGPMWHTPWKQICAFPRETNEVIGQKKST